MNKQQRENMGINLPFLIIASIIAVALILFFIVPGNAIYAAPIGNKLLAGLFAAGAVYYAIGWSKDRWWNNIENERAYFIVNLVIFASLIMISLLILIVFHSGPIGLSTNPVS